MCLIDLEWVRAAETRSVTPNPAYADGPPIGQLTAIVNPPPQPNGLLTLCITVRSLDSTPTCINIPPSVGAPRCGCASQNLKRLRPPGSVPRATVADRDSMR